MRRRVEEMLMDGHRGDQVITLLEDLAGSAVEGSEMALFAHRQLAELCLEGSPWKAALHLRRLLLAGAADDGVHALLGLCHALMGNFRAAVTAYRAALGIAPKNPWYHHNLGHLLDVGLSRPEAALPHLRKAHELEPDEDEVTASLAHCLARLDLLDEAAMLAKSAVEGAPENAEHRALAEWIRQGARAGQPPASPSAGAVAGARRVSGGWPRPRLGPADVPLGTPGYASIAAHGAATPPGGDAATPLGGDHDEVTTLLRDCMGTSGCSVEQFDCARAVWRDFCDVCQPRVAKPAVFAAAVEYAAAKLSGAQGVTQASLAARYGVGSRSVSQRYGEIRDVLGLVPGDPRYGR